MRPRVVGAELKPITHALRQSGLQCIVVGDGIVGASSDRPEDRIRGSGSTLTEFGLRHLVDVHAAGIQVPALVAHIGNLSNKVLGELPLYRQRILIVGRHGRMVLVETHVLPVLSPGSGGCINVGLSNRGGVISGASATWVLGIGCIHAGTEIENRANAVRRAGIVEAIVGTKGVAQPTAIGIFAPGGRIHADATANDCVGHRLPTEPYARHDDVVLGSLKGCAPVR